MQKLKEKLTENESNPMTGLEPNHTSNSRRIIKIIIISLVGLLGVSGIAYAGWLGYQKVINTPEKILQKALSNIQSINSFSYDINVNTTLNAKELKTDDKYNILSPFLSSQDNEDIPAQINIKGNVDIQDNQIINTKASFSLSSQAAGEDNMINGGLIAVPNNLYIKIDKINNFQDSVPDYFVNFITGKWIELPLAVNTSVDPREEQNIISNIIRTDAPKAFTVKQYLGIESINNQPSYHIVLNYNKEVMANFLQKIITSLSREDKNTTPDDFQQNSYWQNAVITMDIWLNKKSYALEQVKINSNYKVSEQQHSNSIIILHNFNKPMNILLPNDAVSINELMSMLIPLAIQNMQLSNINIQSQALPLNNLKK